MRDNHFKHLFWFCVGLFVLAFSAMMALLFVHIPDANREMASNAQGFLQGSLIMSAVGFLLTGNITTSKAKTPEPGTMSVDIQATSSQIEGNKEQSS